MIGLDQVDILLPKIPTGAGVQQVQCLFANSSQIYGLLNVVAVSIR